MRYGHTFDTPLGEMWTTVDEKGRVSGLGFTRGGIESFDWQSIQDPKRCEEVERQLGEYFEGSRREFELPLGFQGTPFQEKVWRELCVIPYGKTISYADLAKRIGNPKAIRAVGRANGLNPIAVVVPCHRVIGSDGTLTGYYYGVELKRSLLELEGALPRRNLFEADR